MDKYQAEVKKLLDENGAVLVRRKKHKVYKLPDGRAVVMASTPSDHRATVKALTLLRRMLDGRLPEGPAAAAPVITEPQTVNLVRRGQAPRPEWSNADVLIPKLDSGAFFKTKYPTVTKPSLRECDFYYIANSSEEFWKLDPYGRIRAIGKVAQIMGGTVEFIDLFYGAVPNEFITASGGNVTCLPVFNRVVRNAHCICHPAVIVGGNTLVEAQAFLRYKKRRRLLVSNYEWNHAATYRLTRNVSLVIYPLAGKLAHIRRKLHVRSNVSEQWFNPKSIRTACEGILNELYQPAA